VSPRERQMQIISMEVDHVEGPRTFYDLSQHAHMHGHWIGDERIELQRTFADGHQLGGRRRVATRKEGDSMALLNLLLCQIGDDTLSSTVELRRNAFVKRSDLRDMKLPVERKG